MTIADVTFSLVVNTIDRAVPLRTLLRSLEHQAYPHFEVIVVVGPTRDETLQVLDEYAGRVRVFRCPTANLSQSRNIGLLAARGDIVAYIDDDAVPCRRWLEQLARLLRDHTLDGTGGSVYTIHPNYATVQHRLGIASALAEQVDVRRSGLEHIVPPGRASQWVTRTMGTNMAIRRRVLLEAGGFDEFFAYIAEETDLIFRLTNAGKRIQPVAEAVVYHVPASSRNRVVFTHKGRWWLRSRSRVYFGIKNGVVAGEPYRTIAWRSFLSVGAHWLWYTQLWRGKQLNLIDLIAMSAMEFRGAMDAVVKGLFSARRLIGPDAAQTALNSGDPLLPFQNAQSPFEPMVDPVNGYRPVISSPTPPLRVCLLSAMYPPAQYDGIGRHTNLIARGLFELGHTVHVIARGEREQISFYDGAYVHRIAPRLGRYALYREWVNLYHHLNYSHAIRDKIKRLILNDGIQIVDSPLWQFEGLVTAIEQTLPVVVRLQTSARQIAALQDARNTEFKLLGDLERALAERAAHLIANSNATWQEFQKAIALSRAIYMVVPHGIVPVPDESVRPFDSQHTPDQFTILYVGRLEKRKGILDLFQAIPRVLAHIPNLRFVIVGADNSRHDGFQIETGMTYPEYFLQHYARFAAQVEFKGAVSDEDLQRFYAACDLFVAPSLYESFGLIYLEAMNYAKPVIGCRAGGIPEVVNDGVTGLLVDPAAPVALAEAIRSLLQSPNKLRELGLAGRERLLRDFTHIQMARRFEQIYRQVISESQRGG